MYRIEKCDRGPGAQRKWKDISDGRVRRRSRASFEIATKRGKNEHQQHAATGAQLVIQ